MNMGYFTTFTLFLALNDCTFCNAVLLFHTLPGCQRRLSRVQTVGMNMGYFTSFTLFLALNDATFCNAVLRSPAAASDVGIVSLAAYFRFWAFIYVVVTLWIWFFKRERPHTVPAPALCAPAPCCCSGLLLARDCSFGRLLSAAALRLCSL